MNKESFLPFNFRMQFYLEHKLETLASQETQCRKIKKLQKITTCNFTSILSRENLFHAGVAKLKVFKIFFHKYQNCHIYGMYDVMCTLREYRPRDTIALLIAHVSATDLFFYNNFLSI